METQQITCKNCEQEHEVGFEFCPHCGQKSKDELTIGVLFYNTISNYFSFDARFLKSFIPLMLKPGFLAKKFIEGKRLMYLHPAQMYLFISVVFFFVFAILTRPITEKLDTALQKTKEKPIISDSLKTKTIDTADINTFLKPLKDNQKVMGLKEAEFRQLDSVLKQETAGKDIGISSNNNSLNFDFDENKVDSLLQIGAENSEIYKAMGLSDNAGAFERRIYAQMLKFYQKRDGGSLLDAIRDSIPLAMFFLLPLFALFLKLFYWRRGRFAHHLVFSFYFFSFLFTVFSLIICVNFIWDIPNWIDWLIAMSTFFYFFMAAKRFYEQGWILSFFKTSVIAFTFLMMVLPVAAFFVAFATFLYY